MKNKLLLFVLLLLTITSCYKQNKKNVDKIDNFTETVTTDSIEIEPIQNFPLESFNFDSIYKEYNKNCKGFEEDQLAFEKGVYYWNQYENIIIDGKKILKDKPAQAVLKSKMKTLLDKKISLYNVTTTFDKPFIIDSTKVPSKKDYDSLIKINTAISFERDSVKIMNSELGQRLLHNKLVVENAKYYLKITVNNPTQDKFLRGWMNRAFSQ